MFIVRIMQGKYILQALRSKTCSFYNTYSSGACKLLTSYNCYKVFKLKFTTTIRVYIYIHIYIYTHIYRYICE
jgi:hypothetical protein